MTPRFCCGSYAHPCHSHYLRIHFKVMIKYICEKRSSKRGENIRYRSTEYAQPDFRYPETLLHTLDVIDAHYYWPQLKV